MPYNIIIMKAITLLSGGLDSTLATRLLLEQGIELEAVNFLTVFCNCTPHQDRGARHTSKAATCLVSKTAADQLGIKLKVFEVSKEYLEIVKNPGHSYGRNLNPCIDCRIFMFKKAGEYMRESGASFIVTGEVLGERPMSQRMDAMRLIERESGLEGFILRPLSAKLFPPTIPEKEGWVDREKFLDIQGRSRKPQIKLAGELGITDYPCPAGGCLLTDRSFSNRMRDLMKYLRAFTVKDVRFLKLGRHFRLNNMAKLVVGRNEKENERLSNMAEESDIQFNPSDIKGPLAIGRGRFSQDDMLLASQIVARYSDRNGDDAVKVIVSRKKDNLEHLLTSLPIEEEKLASIRI